MPSENAFSLGGRSMDAGWQADHFWPFWPLFEQYFLLDFFGVIPRNQTWRIATYYAHRFQVKLEQLDFEMDLCLNDKAMIRPWLFSACHIRSTWNVLTWSPHTPESWTPHPQPYILHPKPWTLSLNPQPQSLNPESSTLNPTPHPQTWSLYTLKPATISSNLSSLHQDEHLDGMTIETRHPNPEPRNLKPQTPNLESYHDSH